MPKQAEVRPVLLVVLNLHGGSLPADAAITAVTRAFPQLTPEDLLETVSSGDNRWRNRVRWARNDLLKDSLIDNRTHGVWSLTAAGLAEAQRIFP